MFPLRQTSHPACVTAATDDDIGSELQKLDIGVTSADKRRQPAAGQSSAVPSEMSSVSVSTLSGDEVVIAETTIRETIPAASTTLPAAASAISAAASSEPAITTPTPPPRSQTPAVSSLWSGLERSVPVLHTQSRGSRISRKRRHEEISLSLPPPIRISAPRI